MLTIVQKVVTPIVYRQNQYDIFYHLDHSEIKKSSYLLSYDIRSKMYPQGWGNGDKSENPHLENIPQEKK